MISPIKLSAACKRRPTTTARCPTPLSGDQRSPPPSFQAAPSLPNASSEPQHHPQLHSSNFRRFPTNKFHGYEPAGPKPVRTAEEHSVHCCGSFALLVRGGFGCGCVCVSCVCVCVCMFVWRAHTSAFAWCVCSCEHVFLSRPLFSCHFQSFLSYLKEAGDVRKGL